MILRTLRTKDIRRIIVDTHVTEKVQWIGIVLFVQNGDAERWW
jgi:hypothetical protein